LKLLAESCSRQLRAWAESLQDSDIIGPRHLNRRTRLADEDRKRAAAFQKVLLSKLPPTHPLVREAQERSLGRELRFQRRKSVADINRTRCICERDWQVGEKGLENPCGSVARQGRSRPTRRGGARIET
jgi:hypothetical protein